MGSEDEATLTERIDTLIGEMREVRAAAAETVEASRKTIEEALDAVTETRNQARELIEERRAVARDTVSDALSILRESPSDFWLIFGSGAAVAGIVVWAILAIAPA